MSSASGQGFHPNIHFECEFPSFIGEAISLGHGVSIISEQGGTSAPCKARIGRPWEENITFRPLKEEYCRQSSAGWPIWRTVIFPRPSGNFTALCWPIFLPEWNKGARCSPGSASSMQKKK